MKNKILDRYIITANDKVTDEQYHTETCTCFGFIMFNIVGGIYDPYKGHARWTYKINKGIITKILNFLNPVK